MLVCIIAFSCNKEWKGEQFEHYVSFKAPLDNVGVSPIHVPYNSDNSVRFELPVIVSGSTNNQENLEVHISVDSDTLIQLNKERFQSRTDLYYKELLGRYYSFPETVTIPANENTALVHVDFNLGDIDLVDKWVLPLTIDKDDAYNYQVNPRKFYSKALLRIIPFNDYSGDYSGTSMKIYLKGEENDAAIVKSIVTTYVVDDHTIFFYAGNVDEDNIDRGKYKIKAEFDERTRTVSFTTENPDMQFILNKEPVFSVEEVMDDVRPYLLHRYVTISNIDYNYTDYTSVEGGFITYTVRGSVIMERKINTQIPDRDQAIEW